MGERQARPHLSCPNCGETVLPDDVFCFHCGRRLKAAQSSPRPVPRHIGLWALALVGVLALVGAGYVIHHQQQALQAALQHQNSPKAKHRSGRVVLHPVVTTTTSYPANLPSSAHWTVEVETYHNVQLSLRLPTSLAHLKKSTSSQWVWGDPSFPYQVTLGVASSKPGAASVSLGTNTWGTPIAKSGSTAQQDLYIKWAPGNWAEVLMTVPSKDEGWLGAIAESVRVS
ncbi:zinc ribbon domain-containing protein [Sulfobacillus harzensis]|uniref:Zinc ribbon domain-containing protein n=1 Tax=Sulfobacillus harzensis TaxID=2729629 RepID=A0A7Y0Q288_9FIRM|nr:zinc ribbon domain-containing protein [Sulfobacillus harzensis]NMP22100.1 zinc ribbon domain-containing protein [Sulfobacillus harzensis]